MEQSKPELVSSLASEIEGLKSLVKEAFGKKTAELDNRLVGIDEACKILRRKKSTIYHMVRDGILPHYKVGKSLSSTVGTDSVAGAARKQIREIY